MNSVFKKCSWFSTDAGLLVLRIGIGALFVFSGYLKAASFSETAAAFAGMGFSLFWVYVITIVEILGGLALILGTFTRIAAGLLAIAMIVAVYVTRSNMMTVMTPFVTLVATLALFFADGGKYSLKQY